MRIRLLKEVLADTLGSIVFQDQVIEVARVLADFTPSEGEGLRRAMSRKRSHEALAAYHLRFVEGAAANGVSEEVAESVFAQIIGFSGFGFPKAHAAAFGLLAYQTSWLRAHYGTRVRLRIDERATDGLLPAGRPGARGAAPGDQGSAGGCEPERGRVLGRMDRNRDRAKKCRMLCPCSARPGARMDRACGKKPQRNRNSRCGSGSRM